MNPRITPCMLAKSNMRGCAMSHKLHYLSSRMPDATHIYVEQVSMTAPYGFLNLARIDTIKTTIEFVPMPQPHIENGAYIVKPQMVINAHLIAHCHHNGSRNLGDTIATSNTHI